MSVRCAVFLFKRKLNNQAQTDSIHKHIEKEQEFTPVSLASHGYSKWCVKGVSLPLIHSAHAAVLTDFWAIGCGQGHVFPCIHRSKSRAV